MVQGDSREQQQQFRADQHKVGDVKGVRSTHQPNPELMWPWSRGVTLQKGKSILGTKIFGSGNDPAGLDSAPLPGPAHHGSDYFMIFFYPSLSGAAEGAGCKVRAHGAPQGFLCPHLGPISPSPLAASHF